MEGSPQREPDSVHSANRLAAQPWDPDPSSDVVDGGGPPRKELPRWLVRGLAVVGLAGTLVWWGVDAATQRSDEPVAIPTSTMTGDTPTGPSATAGVTSAQRQSWGRTPRSQSLTVGHVALSIRLPRRQHGSEGSGWERNASNYLTQSTQGPQGAEAIIYWTGYPDGGWADLCRSRLRQPVGHSAGGIAASMSMAPGTHLVAGPSTVTVDGYPATHLVLTVGQDLGCDPGYFYTWKPFMAGAMWGMSNEGDTIRIWIVAVDRGPVVVIAETHGDARPFIEPEIEQIVQSIRFA